MQITEPSNPIGILGTLNPDEVTALHDLFTFHAPDAKKIEAMEMIRASACELAGLIVALCPRSADRTAAIRKIREAVMTANASIVLEGRNLP